MENEPIHSPPLSGSGSGLPCRVSGLPPIGLIGNIVSAHSYKRSCRTIQALLGVALLGGLFAWTGPKAFSILDSMALAFLIGPFGCTLAIMLCIGLCGPMFVQVVSASSLRLRKSCCYFLWNSLNPDGGGDK